MSIKAYVIEFTNQYDNVVVNPFIKLRLFGSSLTKTIFHWFSTLQPYSINNWGLEFHILIGFKLYSTIKRVI